MSELVLTLISAALVNNVILLQGLAIDPALRMEHEDARQRLHALGLATLMLLLLTLGLGQAIYRFVLLPLDLTYLRLFVFLPLCVLLITPVLNGLQARLPAWPFSALEPLLLGNAALLGLNLQASNANLDLLTSVALGLGSGLGFWLALLLLQDLRQRLDHQAVPAMFRGTPVLLASAGIMGMAVLVLDGLFGA